MITFKDYYISAIREIFLTVTDEIQHDSSCSMETTDIANKITVLDAVYIVKETWNEVNAETIRNCLWFH